jgi:hypothetical protein
VIRRGSLLTALAIAIVAVVRVAALPLHGTEDTHTWKIWAYAASDHVTHVYGIGGHPPVRGLPRWGRFQTTVDYPPAALYELAVVGYVYRLIDPKFEDSPRLMAAIKIPGLICNALITVLLAWTARRVTGRIEDAQWAALAYWVNPATILNGEFLGYLDPLMMLPALAVLILVQAGAAESAGLCLALATLTKPQGILLVPACAIAAWHAGGLRGLARVALGATLGAVVLLLPFAIVGALPNMWLAFGSFYVRRNILSANAANIWWIVNYLLRAWNLIPLFGFPRAFLVPVTRIMAISTFESNGFPNPRPFATSAVLLTSAWGLWRARTAPHLAVHALVAAFTVHAFFVLGVGVHEHHMMLTVPLLALAAALRPAVRPLFYVVSAIVALNMNLFYGISLGMGWVVPRMMLGIDLSVILSIVNVAALVWHGRVLAREADRVTDDAAYAR